MVSLSRTNSSTSLFNGYLLLKACAGRGRCRASASHVGEVVDLPDQQRVPELRIRPYVLLPLPASEHRRVLVDEQQPVGAVEAGAAERDAGGGQVGGHPLEEVVAPYGVGRVSIQG